MTLFPEAEISVLEPGLVHISGALTATEQECLARVALEEGERCGGFYESGKLNSARTRGRIYDTMERFPRSIQQLCLKQVARARGADPAMPAMVPTHLLLLKYASETGIRFHRDNSENDGAGEFPVVSLSIGNSAVFVLKHERDGPETKILLASGDAVLFGGPCRQMLHAVTEVHTHTAPSWLPTPFLNARLNFTFRHAPEILGREKEFALFKNGKPGINPLVQDRRASALEAGSPAVEAGPAPDVGPPRRLCPLDGKPYTQSQFIERHGTCWQRIWEAAPPGPAAAAKAAQLDAERMLNEIDSPTVLTHEMACEKAAIESHYQAPRRRWKKKNL